MEHSYDEIRGIPHDGFWGSNDMAFRSIRALQGTIFALSAVDDLSDCGTVPLSINSTSKYDNYICLTMSNSFTTFANIISDEALETEDLAKAGVISGRGWSLCMSSIVSSDPESVRPGLTILRGVPSREGERKECIRDSQFLVESDCLVESCSSCTIIAVSLSSNNPALRWILLHNLRAKSSFDAVYLKHSKCCVPYAIKFIQAKTSGKIQRLALIA